MFITIIIIAAIFLSLVLGYKSPRWFVNLYITFQTGLFGLYPTQSLNIYYIQNVTTFLLVAGFLVTCLTRRNLSISLTPLEFKFLVPFILIFVLAIIHIPIGILLHDGIYKNLFVFLREYIHILFIIYCVIFIKNENDIICVRNFIIFISSILAFIIIFYSLSGVAPPYYSPVDPNNPNVIENGIHIRYPQIITFALMFTLFDSIKPNPSLSKGLSYLLLVIFIFALIIQPRASITYLSFLVLLFAIYLFFIRSKSLLKWHLISIILFGTIYLIYQEASDVFREFDSRSGALYSRLVINESRLEVIEGNWLFGYGFISENSNVVKSIAYNATGIHDSQFRTIDAGYLDFILIFGVSGLSLFILFYLYLIKSLLISSYYENKILAATLFLFLFVNFTWSVFGFQFGFMSMGMMTLLLKREQKSTHRHFNFQ